MSIPLAIKFEGKKFMWDGETYESEDKAREIMQSYGKKGFEVQLINNASHYLVYSRRVATVQNES